MTAITLSEQIDKSITRLVSNPVFANRLDEETLLRVAERLHLSMDVADPANVDKEALMSAVRAYAAAKGLLRD
ncbi:MAG: hypothetical protein AAFP99_09930 [Pseudomonadota bacterium]